MCWGRNFIWTKITTSGTFSFCLVLSQFFERLLNEHSILCYHHYYLYSKVLVGTEQKRLHCKLRYSVEKTGYACIQAPAKKFQNWKKKFKIRLSKTTFATLLDFSPPSQPVQTKKKKSKGILTRDKPLQRKICDLTIVADHTFFAEVGGGSLDKTILQMLWHIKEANEMIQSEDFDNDGTSECIGFTVSEITIFQVYNRGSGSQRDRSALCNKINLCLTWKVP